MPALERIRVLTVDDHPLLRSGIVNTINAQSTMTVVAEACDGEEAISAYRAHRPDVTLMDLRLPGRSGIETISAIRSEFPRARVVVLTTYSGDVQALQAFRAGACGYLLKSMLRTELLDTIRIVHGGGRRIPPEIASVMAEHAADDFLTYRELEVLRSISSGNSNKMVADHLSVTEHTIKGHVRSILSKLGANDRAHALVIAFRRGIID